MSYTYASLKQVLDVFLDTPLGVTEIARMISKDRSLVHRYLKELVAQGKIEKVGKGSHTKYQLIGDIASKKELQNVPDVLLPLEQADLLDQIFLKFAADGRMLQGADGFLIWCHERGLDPMGKAINYITIYEHLRSVQNSCGMVDATGNFTPHVAEMFLDQVLYADQYKRMEFGRGKLAELTFYAKQSQDYDLIMQSIKLIARKLQCLIKADTYDALAIVPWSIKRQNQLLYILKKELEYLNLPFVKIIKYYPHKIPVPQKSLKTREQRLSNAKNTIFVDDPACKKYKKMLLIDDFVGSGNTLNETAKKLKEEGVTEVVGFAFVGNTDLSYEVINEV